MQKTPPDSPYPDYAPPDNKHVGDISGVPVQPFDEPEDLGGDPDGALGGVPPLDRKPTTRRGDEVVWGEEDHGKRNLLIAGTVIIVIAVIAFSLISSAFSKPGGQAHSTSTVKPVAYTKTANSLANTTQNSTRTQVTLYYNQSENILDQYVYLFGYSNYDVPAVPSQNIRATGPDKWLVGPYPEPGYIEVSYFTNPGYDIYFNSYSALGNAESEPAQFGANIPLYIVANQTYEIDLNAAAPYPYDPANNTVSVHVVMTYVPIESLYSR